MAYMSDHRKVDVENALKMAAADDEFVTYSELRENLKHSNFSDMEIDLFFDMFNEDPEMKDMIKNDDEVAAERMEEERRALEEGLEEDGDEEVSDSASEAGSDLADSFVSRPMSGKEMRMARSARIRAAHEGKKPLDANRWQHGNMMSRFSVTHTWILTMLFILFRPWVECC